jgi:hypothetical protein
MKKGPVDVLDGAFYSGESHREDGSLGSMRLVCRLFQQPLIFIQIRNRFYERRGLVAQFCGDGWAAARTGAFTRS